MRTYLSRTLRTWAEHLEKSAALSGVPPSEPDAHPNRPSPPSPTPVRAVRVSSPALHVQSQPGASPSFSFSGTPFPRPNGSPSPLPPGRTPTGPHPFYTLPDKERPVPFRAAPPPVPSYTSYP